MYKLTITPANTQKAKQDLDECGIEYEIKYAQSSVPAHSQVEFHISAKNKLEFYASQRIGL